MIFEKATLKDRIKNWIVNKCIAIIEKITHVKIFVYWRQYSGFLIITKETIINDKNIGSYEKAVEYAKIHLQRDIDELIPPKYQMFIKFYQKKDIAESKYIISWRYSYFN